MKIKKFFTIPVITAVVILPILIFYTGCNLIVGVAAALSTPTSSEIKVPAEYDLSAMKGKKIVVLVDQPLLAKNQVNIRFLMANALNILLQEQLKIPAVHLISYEAVSEFRSYNPYYSTLTPDKVGTALGADIVLFVTVDDCRISHVSQSEFINGDLTVHAQLIKAATGRILWPMDESARAVTVAFESDRHGKDAAQKRLVSAAARCITRYLYNGPKNQFKVSDEKSDVGWGQ
jgi:hypothetical protein